MQFGYVIDSGVDEFYDIRIQFGFTSDIYLISEVVLLPTNKLYIYIYIYIYIYTYILYVWNIIYIYIYIYTIYYILYTYIS